MTIICPSCEASYRIDVATLGAGRTVRCARCRAEWFAAGGGGSSDAPLAGVVMEPIHSLDDAAAIDTIESADPRAVADPLDVEIVAARPKPGLGRWFGARRNPDAAARRARKPAARRLGGLFRPRPAAVVAAAGLAALGALIGGRTEVVRAAPSLASLYAGIGMPVNVRGLSIRDVQSLERIEEGVPLLLVSGVVANVSGDAIEVPRLRLAITASGGRELYAWTTVAARAKLAPGETATFRARLASPPAEGGAVAVRFVAEKDLAARADR